MAEATEYDNTIVISDLLSFMACKVHILSKNNLLNCLRNFYSKKEIDEALKTFMSSLPSEKLKSYISKSKNSDALNVFYDFLKNSCPQDLPVFVCKNLNNIPKLDSKGKMNNVQAEDKDLVSEQNFIKSQITEITSLVYQLKDQIAILTENKSGKTSKQKKERGLAYLQKLIDEEENQQHGHILNKHSFDEDCNESMEEEESLHLKANRVQRTLAKNVESMGLKRKKVNHISHSSPESSESEFENEPVLKQQVIHIENDDVESSDSPTQSYSELHETKHKNVSEKISLDVDSSSCHDEASTISPKDSDAKGEKFPFIVVEQVFDESVGHFSIYKCSLCNFSTNDASAVQQHDCPQIYCDASPDGKEDTESKSFRYFCLHCRFRCNAKLLFRKHQQIHPQPYPCPFCREKLQESEQWTKHVMACLTSSGRKPEDHVCQICDVVYANANALTVHKGFHDPAKPFECLKCKYRFYTQETLDRHFKSHVINGFKCPFCHFVNKNKTTLGTHLRCHTGEMPFGCQYCDYRSSSQSALTSHSFCHTNERPVKCDECPAFFKTLHKLNSHKITHSKNREHKCPACGKGFKTGWLMTIHHQRIHLNLRPYPCDHCNYKARSLSALKSHHNTHLNEKLFKCFDCDFRANHKAYLKRHINTWHVKNENE